MAKAKLYRVPVIAKSHRQYVDIQATSLEEAKELAGVGSITIDLQYDANETIFEVVSFVANNKGYSNEQVDFFAEVA